jgi:DNA helicase-2/ATP-dependent DNA helicase PcrA
MTVHKSKGLEWFCVFVVGFAMNLLPHHRSLRYVDGELMLDSLEEERRIAYVAITRAKERLYLSWPMYHNAKSLGASPFLIEMPTLAPLVDDALRTQTVSDDDTMVDIDE